jgi:3-dehydroquinate synthase
MAVESISVKLGSRSYNVRIGDGVWSEVLTEIAARTQKGQRCVAITSPAIAAARPESIQSLQKLMPVLISTNDGEKAKSAEELARIWNFLAENRVARDGAVFALGGGVIGDLAGFAAATYQRGIDFIQVPTTLLAMVDSSVGGKTGINLAAGKNLVGSFHQPKVVFADTSILSTLPPREFAAGMAEVIKHALIADRALFVELETSAPLSWKSPSLPKIIRRCVEIKAEVVAGDEFETQASGGRALLNLGHTFGHAIEAVAGYGNYLHGEAVAIGLVMAAQLSAELGQCTANDVAAIEKTIAAYQLPTRLRSPLAVEDLLAAMRRDKKVREGKLRFVLLKNIGAAQTTSDVPETLARKIFIAGGASA